MAIRINSWGGIITWGMRKYLSTYTSRIALKSADIWHRKKIKQYIDWFQKQETIPMFQQVMLETINRCNGTCAFCPANIKDEKRTFKKMQDPLIDKIIEELKKLEFQGNIYLNVNNEPFMDTRLLAIAKKIKYTLPRVKVYLITNGTLLTKEKLTEAASCIDNMIINNYSTSYRLNPNIKAIYKFVKERANSDIFKGIDITINRRYIKEVLATRAGSAPNKSKKDISLETPCIYPFTDLTIFPDGNIGLCCNDCYEVTSYGNVNKEGLYQIWIGKKFIDFRKHMMMGRTHCDFCRECDVMDAGSREKII